VSVAAAIRRGRWQVKTPANVALAVVTLALVAASIFLDAWAHFPLAVKIGLAVLSFLIGLAAACLLWAWLVPLWRLWAYERVDDFDALEEAAVDADLIWPRGHSFERFEIRPPALAAKLRVFETPFAP
jgi:hypothetical protein